LKQTRCDFKNRLQVTEFPAIRSITWWTARSANPTRRYLRSFCPALWNKPLPYYFLVLSSPFRFLIQHFLVSISHFSALFSGASPMASSSNSFVEDSLALELIETNMYRSTRPLWHPPGARGVFGGAVIAQALSAALKTIDAPLKVHSLHSYFVLA
jgi:Thioesterase-like superfamily